MGKNLKIVLCRTGGKVPESDKSRHKHPCSPASKVLSRTCLTIHNEIFGSFTVAMTFVERFLGDSLVDREYSRQEYSGPTS